MNKPIKMQPLAISIALISGALLNPLAASDTLPYQFVVSPYSEYSADEIYVAVVGYQNGGYAFMDFDDNFEINQMDASDNTLSGGDGYYYIDMFKPLSEIEDQTIPMPELSSVRMYIGFGSPLYIRYDTIADSGGYVAPTINNEGDANYGLRFEMVELTYNEYGLWTNTTRVDSYQYPMGIEVWGDNGFYKRVGELLTHDEIVTAWQSMTNEEYQFENLYLVDGEYDIILNPSHHEDFSSSDGQYEDYFDDYVNAVWTRYSSENLCLSIGEAGKWVGKVNSDNEFVFTEYTNSYTDENSGCSSVSVTADAMISDAPSTYEILSASGVLAEDVSETSDTDNDKNIQKHFSAGFNRGAIDLDAGYDEWISWDDADSFFNNSYYGDNNYVEFWHSEDISFEGETYAFAYDDVFDYSSTIHTTSPEEIQVTLGGFAADPYVASTGIELSCDTLTLTPGSSTTLTAEVEPSDASNSTVVWSTSNSSIVSVDDGEITGIDTGSATITASSYTEDVSASCVVTVADEVDENFIERIEAEDYTDMYGVQTETTSDTDGGENVGWIDPDDWMEYSIDVPASGTYQLDFRLASPYSIGSFDIKVDDEVLGSISVNYTGSYQSWVTQSTEVYLSEGEQTLTIYVTGDGWNINWFEINSTGETNTSTDDSSSDDTTDNSADGDDSAEETTNDTTDDTSDSDGDSESEDNNATDSSEDTEESVSFGTGTLYLIEADANKSLSLNSGSSESGAVITGTSVNDAISFAYSGINASYNNGDMSYNLCFDTVASTIATAPKVALYYDFDGDGSTDRTETAGYFALDPIADSWECWSSETSTYTVTGDDYQDFDNGSVTLLIWNALGDANTTEVKVNASTDASVIYIPYTESSTDDNATDEGTDEGTDESTEEGTDDTTESSGDWSLIWQDEFDTDEIDTSKWDLEENCWGGGNNEQQCYTDQESNAYIDDSILYITAINESYTGASANEDDASYDVNNTTTLPYTSARLRTKNLADFKYGRFEIRAKLPSGQGTWPAIWMLPTDYVYGTWAASGEIDIMEAVNLGTESDASDAEDGELERRVYGTLHYGETWPDNVYSGTNYELPDGESPADDFHVYAIEWEEGAIRWYVDGVHYATQTSDNWYTQYEDENGDTVNGEGAAPFDEYFHIIMNLAVGGDWAANVNETGIDSTAFPAQMAVDYVRVYQCSADPDTGLGCATESDDAELVEGYTAPEIITLDEDFLSTPLTMIYEDSLDDNLYFQSYNPDGTISYSEVAADDHGTVLQIDKTGTTGNVYLATGTESDFSDWVENGAVVFDMRVLSKADDAEFLIKLDSGWPYVSDYSVALPADTEWVETTIMISDILANDNSYSAGNYADITSITNLLVLEPTDEMSIQLDNIRLEEQ